MDFGSMPSVSVQPVASATMATAGIVSPMLASAEPMARFRLVCRRLARAARRAASASGSSTTAAMMMPTSALGAPAAATAASMLGDRALPRSTTAARQASSRPPARAVAPGPGRSACAVASVAASAGRK
ncbi:MAG: hypothetical protein BWX79_01901 [Alphaproteobacteria bacterium ADurb.Bin100]|nr:MAG: hypothetical protein BWX79_01901 [Alphaproteobacteria bacterium ADurb.Bin100]